MTTFSGRSTREHFEHAVLVADSDDALDRLLVPVLRHHIRSGEPALLVVSRRTERIVRDRLGSAAGKLGWGDPGAFYQRLGFVYEGFRRHLEQEHAEGRSVHVIAEPDFTADLDLPVDRATAYLAYEAICNDVCAGFGCPVTCIWDSRHHSAEVIECVRSVHAHELTAEGRQRNSTFVRAREHLEFQTHATMPPAPRRFDIEITLYATAELGPSRAAVRAWAGCHGFSVTAAFQVTTAVNEVLTNGLEHGRPPVRLRAWRHGTTLAVQVDDHGGRRIPPDAGYRPPRLDGAGIGLWMTRQLADVVLTRTTGDVTTVRLYFPHAVTHRGLDGG
ncbi:hypothetical protein GCM10022267_10570 [Lentzea roselyniae]|uniref:Anti-sigma regulatory factor (Ser/Thr protein kinase) n=1 Tax=Lentzea roselyniae TaxID=531940 RepID=A0ABP7A770_9PSEU